ncbi:MAG: hypothetical protein LBC07_02840 [Elusimicrobiota bacterium]|jgi:hypothetical protein|nr:hypothetical protein [Elusimicrobiota bacterium]
MRRFCLCIALALLFISQAAYADKNLLNELIEDVTDTKGSYYMEYYLLSSQGIWDTAPYADWVIEHPYSLQGWHGIVPYNLYRSGALELKKVKLKRMEGDKELSAFGLRGFNFEIYAFKKYSSNIINSVLYTIEIVAPEGISITKYYDNTRIAKQYFEYNEEFESLLRGVIPASQLRKENGWSANFK